MSRRIRRKDKAIMFGETNKALGRGQLLKGATLGAFAALGPAALLQVSTAEAAEPSLVGVWMTTNSGEGDVDLIAFTKDGLMIDAGSVPLKAPAPSDNTPITVGLGSWAQAATGGYIATFISLAAGKDGAFQGTFTIDAHATLSADGNTFVAPYRATARAGEKVVYAGTGSVTGTRIKPAM
jgi:hypothetical protein